MKKFKFNLEGLLVIRDWEEQQARQVLAQANAMLSSCEAQIENLRNELDGAYQGWNANGQQRFTPVDRMSLASLVSDIEGRLLQANSRKRQVEQEKARAMESLTQASRKLKVVQKLKEKRFNEYSADLMKREALEIEDIFNARRSA